MILEFDVEPLKELVAYSKAKGGYLKPFANEYSDIPIVWLVKDHGVYLMPAVEKREPGKHIVYARDLSPDDEHWYATADAGLGGDDFADAVPMDWITMSIDHGMDVMRINVMKDKIALVLEENSTSKPSPGSKK